MVGCVSDSISRLQGGILASMLSLAAIHVFATAPSAQPMKRIAITEGRAAAKCSLRHIQLLSLNDSAGDLYNAGVSRDTTGNWYVVTRGNRVHVDVYSNKGKRL